MSPKTPNDAEEFTFYVWRLSNYSDHFKLGGNKRLKSPVFSLSKDRSLSFSLHFYNKCPVEGYEHFVALGLGIERFGGNKVVKVNFSIWIEEETGGEIVKRGGSCSPQQTTICFKMFHIRLIPDFHTVLVFSSRSASEVNLIHKARLLKTMCLQFIVEYIETWPLLQRLSTTR